MVDHLEEDVRILRTALACFPGQRRHVLEPARGDGVRYPAPQVEQFVAGIRLGSMLSQGVGQGVIAVSLAVLYRLGVEVRQQFPGLLGINHALFVRQGLSVHGDPALIVGRLPAGLELDPSDFLGTSRTHTALRGRRDAPATRRGRYRLGFVRRFFLGPAHIRIVGRTLTVPGHAAFLVLQPTTAGTRIVSFCFHRRSPQASLGSWPVDVKPGFRIVFRGSKKPLPSALTYPCHPCHPCHPR